MSWGRKGWGTEWWSKLHALFAKMGGSPVCFWPPAKEAHPVHSYHGDLTVLFSRGHKTGCDVKSQISNPWSLLQFYSTWKTTCICWPWDGLPPKEKLFPASHRVGVGVTHAPPTAQAPWILLSPDSESEGTSKVIHRCLLAFHHPQQIAMSLLF